MLPSACSPFLPLRQKRYRRDCYPFHPQVEKSAIFIYDGYPGGVGLAQHGFEIILELLEKTLDHLKSCQCEDGCPSCIHSPKCGSGNKPLDKRAALVILECLLGSYSFEQTSAENLRKALSRLIGYQRAPVEEKRPSRCWCLTLKPGTLPRMWGAGNTCTSCRYPLQWFMIAWKTIFLSMKKMRVNELLDHLEKADLVVGFNVKRFDYRVLSAYTGMDFQLLPTFDILEDIYQSAGFSALPGSSGIRDLNHGKTADGLQAVEWFREGNMEKLTDYCRNDVAVTKDLFFFGLEKGHLVYREKKQNRRVRLLVDWNLEDIIRAEKDG